MNVKMADIGPSGDLNTEVEQRETTTAMPLKGSDDLPNKAMIEAHNPNHLHAAPWWRLVLKLEAAMLGATVRVTTAKHKVRR